MAHDLTRYTFDELIEEVSKKLSETGNWGSAYNSSQGQTLVQLFGDSVEQLFYQLMRRSQENYFSTARLDSSIKGLANASAYNPRRNISSTGWVQLNLLDDDGNQITPEGNILIPRYSQIILDDMNFVNVEDVYITSTDNSVEFEVREGIPKSDTFSYDSGILGDRGYIRFKDYDDIENTSIRVIDAGGDEWVYVKNSIEANKPPLEVLSFAGPDDKVFDVRIATDGLRIIFGNDTFGKKPDSDITVEWVETIGDDLSIMSTDLEMEFDSLILEDDITTTPANGYGYNMFNTTPIIGGLKAESIDDIKIKAPEYVKTSNRAMTREDFNRWVLDSGIGGIIAVNTYGEHELGVNVINMNNVYINYLTSTGTPLSVENETAIRDYLRGNMYLNTHPVFELSEFIDVQLNISIRRASQLRVSDSEVFRHLRNKLQEYFEFKEDSIKKPVYHSELVEWLQTMTIIRDGREQNIARYLTLNMKALNEFETPFEDYEVDVDFSVGDLNDVYQLDLQDNLGTTNTISYTDTSGVLDDIIGHFETEINALAFYSANRVGNILTISVDGDSGSFYIQNENSTNTDNILIMQEIQLPPKLLYNPMFEQMFEPETIEVIDADGNVLSTDDGLGNIFGNQGTVNYVSGLVTIPLMGTGTYYVRYQQDDTQNILPNEQSVLRLIDSKVNFSDTEETLTTIEFRS